MSIRPRRSALYVPAASCRMLAKARKLDVDVIIIDLEDSVAPDAKQQAREQLVTNIHEGGYGKRQLVARVNALDSPWGRDDIATVAQLDVDAVLLPKVNGPDEVLAAIAALADAGAPADLPLWVMAETPRGILEIAATAAASPRLEAIVLGTSDLAKDMRIPFTPERVGLLVPLSLCVLAARAHGLDVLDGVYPDINDHKGLEQSCAQARELGLDGKTLIHPSQLKAANRTFTPNKAAVAHARRVVAAWQQAQAAGQGVTVLNGRLIERLHVDEAERILALTAAIEAHKH